MTKKRAIIALTVAIATLIGIAVVGSNAGATSYYEEDDQHCYISDCESSTTTVQETTTTVAPETTTTMPVTTTTTMPDIEPEIGTPLVVERELPPYVAPVTPIQPEKPISFTG